VATAELALELEWHVVDDLYINDHYPIITSVDFPSFRKRWRMETANWESYIRQIKSKLQGEKNHKMDYRGTTRANTLRLSNRGKEQQYRLFNE
jgi:hypothetical protein